MMWNTNTYLFFLKNLTCEWQTLKPEIIDANYICRHWRVRQSWHRDNSVPLDPICRRISIRYKEENKGTFIIVYFTDMSYNQNKQLLC